MAGGEEDGAQRGVRGAALAATGSPGAGGAALAFLTRPFTTLYAKLDCLPALYCTALYAFATSGV